MKKQTRRIKPRQTDVKQTQIEEKIKTQKNGNVHRYVYYHCTKRKKPNCSQKAVRQIELEKQIADILSRINIPPEFCKWAIGQLKEVNSQEVEDRNKILANQRKGYQLCVQKLDTLVEMRMAEEISQEVFLQKKAVVLKEKERLQELLNDTDGRVSQWVDGAETLFNFAEAAKNKFENGTKQEKKEILAALGSDLSLKSQKLSVSVQKPLLLLEKAAQEIKSIHQMLEPLKKPINIEQIEDLYSKSPILLRG